MEMNFPGERWEQGSEFHWVPFKPSDDKIEASWEQGVFFGSGRDALRALLLHGMRERGWRRLWIPSYFCQEVVRSMASTRIEMVLYHDSMLETSLRLAGEALEPGDALFVVNFFGIRDRLAYDAVPGHVDLVEDHTHDPWSDWARNSQASFCVASLRKTLPVPEGGVLWSPKGHRGPRPSPAHAVRQKASRDKLAAMVMKKLYLEGHAVDKEVYRQLAMDGERRIASDDVAGMTDVTRALLDIFPTKRWRETRRDNHAFFAAKLLSGDACRLLPTASGACCPFSAILLFDGKERRDGVRQKLIERRIYPVSYWPLEEPVFPEGTTEESIDLSHRVLSIHCDMRYRHADMERVADEINGLTRH